MKNTKQTDYTIIENDHKLPRKRVAVMMQGSKSYTNRALIMAALAEGQTHIRRYSKSDDSTVLIKALRQVGVSIIEDEDELIIQGKRNVWPPVSALVNVGHAGTAARLFLALASYIPGTIIIDGSERLRERPIADLVDALRALGSSIDYLEHEGVLPVRVHGGHIKGGTISLNGAISSQYVSALLLLAPVLKNGLAIDILGNQISKSYIDMTLDGMRHFGVSVKNDEYKKYRIDSTVQYTPCSYTIEGDSSGASYFWGMAALTNLTVRVCNVSPSSAQGDVHFPDILERMGCTVKKNGDENWIEVTGPEKLRAIEEVNMESMPDTAQTLAVIASFARGETKITGLSTLRVKETDRIYALQCELEKMGVHVASGNDFLIIEGGNPHTAHIETYNDHRMAMAFAVAAVKIPSLHIENPEVVTKSFPGFWEEVKKIT